MKTFLRIKLFIATISLVFPFLLAQTEYKYKTEKVNIKVTPMLTSLNHPWSMVWFPNAKSELPPYRGLIAERNGGLVLFDLNTGKKKKLNLPTSVKVYQSGQGGLLDILLDPDYSKNGWVYLTFSLQKGVKNTTALSRFKIINQRIKSFNVLFEAIPYTLGGYHFGSRLVFPQDSGRGHHSGYLFMTVGERNLKRPAQNKNNHLGKVLRFDYRKNFIAEVYSYGHRNPQGLVWDPVTGNLLAHEHGAKGGDEINIIEKDKNYGWPVISYGRNYDGSKIGVGISKPGMEQPMYYWDPSIAPSGFVVYHGKEFPKWEGNLLVGSLKFGLLVRLELNSLRNKVIKEEKILNNRLGRVRYVGINPQGEVFILTDQGRGSLYKITRIR